MDSNEVYRQNLNAGRKVACMGFKGRLGKVDEKTTIKEAAIQLQKSLQQLAFSVRLD